MTNAPMTPMDAVILAIVIVMWLIVTDDDNWRFKF
jgi:hypothetical protein